MDELTQTGVGCPEFEVGYEVIFSEAIELAKKFIQVFPYNHTEKPKHTLQPIQ